MAALEAKTDKNSDESLFADEKPKSYHKNNQALDRKGSNTRQSCADTWWLELSKGDSQPSVLRDCYNKPLTLSKLQWLMLQLQKANLK